MTCNDSNRYQIYHGKNEIMSIQIKIDGVPLTLSGRTVKLLIADQSMTERESEVGVIISNSTPSESDGFLHFSLSSSDTHKLSTKGNYVWRLKVEQAGVSEIWTPLYPIIVLQ